MQKAAGLFQPSEKAAFSVGISLASIWRQKPFREVDGLMAACQKVRICKGIRVLDPPLKENLHTKVINSCYTVTIMSKKELPPCTAVDGRT